MTQQYRAFAAHVGAREARYFPEFLITTMVKSSE